MLGLECSRLARNSADWHQLLELCGMTGTLICDEDGLYDPRNFNDRLLLGMKGQLSEAELHFIKARLRGWAKQAQIDRGLRPGTASADAARIRALERENAELRRVNAILRTASAFFAAELGHR